MIEPRKKLSLRLQATAPRDEAGTVAVLTQAMNRRSCLTWTYNRTAMRAAPQILYWRNDGLHCDAIVVERNGVMLAEAKLGSFRLSGLGDVALAGAPVGLSHGIDIADERYRDGIVLRIAD
jgi:hypothetical protein